MSSSYQAQYSQQEASSPTHTHDHNEDNEDNIDSSPSPTRSRYSTPISSPVAEHIKIRREASPPPLPAHHHLYSGSSFKRARTSSPSCPSSPASTAAHTPISIGNHQQQELITMAVDHDTEAGADPIAQLHIDDSHSQQQGAMQRVTQIESLLAQPLVVGQYWYPIPKEWYTQWQQASRQGAQPLPLDCSPLADESSPSLLRTGLEEDHDYVLAPQEAIELLLGWHGDSQGPLFKRPVVQVDSAPPTLELYVPQLAFSLITSDANTSTITSPQAVSLSRATPLSQVKEEAVKSLDISAPIDHIRLWTVPTDASPSLYTSLSEVIQGQSSGQYTLLPEGSPLASFLDRPPTQVQPIAVEIKGDEWPTASTTASSQSKVKGIFAQNDGDYWTKLQQNSSVTPAASTSSSSPSVSAAAGPSSQPMRPPPRKPGRTRGLKGLANLGNTCFMNSALQCLSNTPELKDYFVSEVFEQEINEDNPLGNQGALARAFGNLIQQLWSGQGTSHPPRDFKWALARFAPQFSGYAQQDTQELLAFLLDGLHEDLNRIKKKPYIEAPDWEGGGLEEMVRFAKRQWEIYKMRNDSVIVDLFQGQYRSTLVCPECSKVSIKFDPFMYLTLPLPNTSLWRHTIIYIPFDPTQPMERVNMALPAETSIAKLKQTLGEMFGAKHMFGAEIYSMKLFRFFHDYEPVHGIEKADYAIFWELPFELPTSSPVKNDNKASAFAGNHSPTMAQSPILEEKYGNSPAAGWKDDREVILPVYTHATRSRGALGIPFFIRVPKEDYNDVQAIHSLVAQQYARFVERHDELMQIINEQQKQQALPATDTTSTPEDWDLVDASGSSSGGGVDGDVVTVNHHDTIDDEEENSSDDVVTEIRPDGQIIESCDFRASQRRQSAARLPPVVQMLSESGTTDASQSNNHKKEAVFELHYMAANSTPKKPIFKDAENWDRYSEELVQRSRRLNESQSEVEPTDRIPLVYRGGALVCVWQERAADEFLPRCDSNGTWGSNIEEVDDVRTATEKQEAAANGGRARRGKEQLSIEDCLNEFTKEEQLGAEDPWYCPQCKEFRQATKKFDLWKVPDILVVHLKRFSAGRGLRDKIDTVVDFPLTGFDLSERVRGAKAVKELKAEGKLEDLASSIVLDTGAATPADNSSQGEGGPGAQDLNASILSAISEANDDAVASDAPIYDLFAVDNHYGGLGGGHYTAAAKNAEDEQWYYFDDSSVRKIGMEEVKGPAAYLLFYRRRTTRPIGGKSREIVKSHVASHAVNDPVGMDAAAESSDEEPLPKRPLQKSRRPYPNPLDGMSDESSRSEPDDTTMDAGGIVRMDADGNPLPHISTPLRPLGKPHTRLPSDSDSDSDKRQSWLRGRDSDDEHLPSPTLSESSEPFGPVTTFTTSYTPSQNEYISSGWPTHEVGGQESPPPPYEGKGEVMDIEWNNYMQKAIHEQRHGSSSSDVEEEEQEE